MQTTPHKPLADTDAPKKWYKEFWAWFVLFPLIVVVIVSSYTVSLAVRHADDRVIDNYYKEGRMINMRIDEDLAAARVNLVANLVFDQEIGELILNLQHDEQNFPEQLTLELSHPSDESLDHSVVLQHIAQGRYQTELSRELSYRWYLRVLPVMDKAEQVVENQPWRLRGEIDFSQVSSVQLSSEF